MGYDDRKPNTDLAILYIASNIKKDLSLASIAEAAGMPPNSLTRHFNHRFNLSPLRWMWAFKAILATRLILQQPYMSLSEAAVRTGFRSLPHFSRKTREVTGIPPSQYRESCLHTDFQLIVPIYPFTQILLEHQNMLDIALDQISKEISSRVNPSISTNYENTMNLQES